MAKQFTIKWKGIHLSAALHYPKGASEGGKWPLIIICHGFTSSKIGANRLFVHAARRFAENGFAVLRFDYAGSGESEGDYGSTRFESFIEQTEYVIQYARALENINHHKMILLGHSLGGAAALCAAVRNECVNKLILWSAVGSPFEDIVNIVGRDQYSRLNQNEALDYLGYSLKKEFFDSQASFDPILESKHFNGDVLVIHGAADKEIPSLYSEDYEKAFLSRNAGSCTKYLIEEAGHTYSSCKERQTLIQLSIEWLYRTVKNEKSASDK